MDIHHIRTVSRMEFRRRWRKLRDNEIQLVAMVLGGIFLLLFFFIALGGLFFAGSILRSGEMEDPVLAARTGAVYLWVIVTAFATYLLYIKGLKPDHLDGLLTTISHREVILGLIVTEVVIWSVPTAIVSILGAIAFGAGARSMLSVPLIAFTIWSIIVIGLLVGVCFTLGIKNIGIRSRLLTRLRWIVITALVLGYIWVLFTQAFATVMAPLHRLLLPTPLSWYGDVAVLGVSGDASIVRAGGALALTAGTILLGTPVVSKLAEWYWYGDPYNKQQVQPIDHDTTRESRILSRFSAPVSGIILVDWRRASRAPITLSFVIYPLVLLISPVMTAVQTGTLSNSLPILVALCGAWITGSVFTLNILGNEGAVLPVTVLASSADRALLYGHMAAAALIGIPVTAFATLFLAIASPLSLPQTGTLVITALVLTCSAGPIATGIGATFPRFETVNVSRSRKAIVPSMLAFVLYSGVLLVVAAPSLLLHTHVLPSVLANFFAVPVIVITIGGVVMTSVLAIGTGILSFKWAKRSIRGFYLE